MPRRVQLPSFVAALGFVGLVASACTRDGDDGASGAQPPQTLVSAGALGPHLAVNLVSADDAGGDLTDDDATDSPTSDLDSLPGGASARGQTLDERSKPSHGPTFNHASEPPSYHDGGRDERASQPLPE